MEGAAMNDDRHVAAVITPAHRKFGYWSVIVKTDAEPASIVVLSYRTEKAALEVAPGYAIPPPVDHGIVAADLKIPS